MKQSLAIKYRPKSFEDMTEQTEITQILNAMLAKGLDSRCFLFVGSAGIGKTTAARILANMINDGKGMPIEIDGATNGSVENARNIVAGAKTRSLESNYKVYIIDECFRGDTLISVPGGAVPIKDIKVGDTVYNLNRVGKVTQVFQNKVFTDRLCRVVINGVETYTTVDHLYLTNIGWVEASKLQQGDVVYSVQDVKDIESTPMQLGCEQNSCVKTLDIVCKKNEETACYQLQSRPHVLKDKADYRGGWCIPQMEKWFVARCEENTVVDELRVESVEVYKRGHNDEYFECAFDDKELSSGVVTMYDLQVEGHPSYFANGVLVHNCHSISNAAWQSLLLVLEQPPQHTCFIFCTTNPEKIPGTILSRVQRFDFRRISLEGIVSRLTHILNAEISEGQPYTYTQEAVEYIAKLAKGGMRSAITSLEKCLNYDANLTLQSVMNALGIVDYTKLFDLADCVLDYNTKGALAIIQQAHDDGKDLKLFMSDFTAFVLDVCKYALTADYSTIKIPNTYSARLLELCKDFKFFKDFLSKLIELNNSIKYERDPKSVIEMNFVVWSSK